MGDAEESFSLRQSSVQKAPSKSRSNYERADGGKKGGGGGSKKIGLPQILAIVAIIITLVALVLAIYCALLWWFWPLALTLPALTLAMIAIILAFVASSHSEAIIVCSALGIIFGLCGLVWGAVEIALCHSYQGPLKTTLYYTKFLEHVDKMKGKDFKYKKAQIYHQPLDIQHPQLTAQYASFCRGRCYDWFYKKQILMQRASCGTATQENFKDKFLKSGSKYVCQFEQIALGVDQYFVSPIYQTHMDFYERSRQIFSEDAKENKSSREIALGKFCDNLDVTELVEQRKKCDAKLEKEFKPICRSDIGTRAFDVTKSKCADISQIKECNKAGLKFLEIFTILIDLGDFDTKDINNQQMPENPCWDVSMSLCYSKWIQMMEFDLKCLSRKEVPGDLEKWGQRYCTREPKI